MTATPVGHALGGDAAPFGIYVHWPYCLSKCPYCDFNSHVTETIDHGRWQAAYRAEVAYWAAETPGRTVTSIFFGGGTPSLMQPDTVAAAIDAIRAAWQVDPQVEITMEANPTSVEAGRFAGFRAAGVNRVSLGVQALDDGALAALGRTHSAAQALAAVAIAQRHFPRVSFDLTYARPGQTEAAWRSELAHALDHAGGHLSAYQLTIEPGTPFAARHARGEIRLPDEDTAAALYESTQDVMERAGRPAYEISNHARPGEECRHNLVYWQTDDYVGVGPGAHGRVTAPDGTKHATRAHRAPAVWLDRVDRDGHAVVERTPVARPERALELLLMGLRLTGGIDPARWRRESGRGLDESFDAGSIAALVEAGYLEFGPNRLAATAAGRQRLDAVIRALAGAIAA